MKQSSQQRAHKSGVLKQQNKRHKTGTHRSKGQIDKEKRGRSDVKGITKKTKRELSKLDRKHRLIQIRKNKRETCMQNRLAVGYGNAAPAMLTIISLDAESDPAALLRALLTADENSVVSCCDRDVTFLNMSRFNRRFAFIVPKQNDIFEILDALKVSDAALVLWPLTGELDTEHEKLLSEILAQGMPATISVTMDSYSNKGRKREFEKRRMTQLLDKWSFDKKIFGCENASDGLTILRHIQNVTRRELAIQKNRSYMIVEKIETENTDSNECNLKITGYLRGRQLGVNELLYFPGWGTFQMARIDLLPDPRPLESERKKSQSMEQGEMVLDVSNPNSRTSLQSEAIPDPMAGEQTWPTDEELKEAKKTAFKKVPQGTSEYQAAWISDEEDDDEDDDDDDASDSDEDEDFGEVDMKPQDDEESSDGENNDKLETMTMATSEVKDTEDYDAEIDLTEEQEMLQLFRKQRENEQFPDEIDTPLDIAARVRFQRYRGLKSFRTSPWDVNENLPSEYARIFQFQDFKRARKVATTPTEKDSSAMAGSYVRVHVLAVPKSLTENLSPTRPLVAFSLLQHEQKMSIINVVVKKHWSCNVSIQSKQRLLFQIGCRRFWASPIFSQHTNGDKHKYERFLPDEAVVVATIFAPITFPPTPVTVFRENANKQLDLVATGAMLDANPKRIVVKRIVLSGYPMKIKRRTAVVRYMFFNRDDIMWFKPVELRTRRGRRGHIKEPLGTHGHMKCIFDGQLNSQDVVLMNLYKRVFPKWTYEGTVVNSIQEEPSTMECDETN